VGAQVPRGDEVVPAALEVSPHVALLDIEMPGAMGLDAAERLGEALPSCRVLILTTFGRPGYLCRAIPVSRHRSQPPVYGDAEARRAQPRRSGTDGRGARLALRLPRHHYGFARR